MPDDIYVSAGSHNEVWIVFHSDHIVVHEGFAVSVTFGDDADNTTQITPGLLFCCVALSIYPSELQESDGCAMHRASGQRLPRPAFGDTEVFLSD